MTFGPWWLVTLCDRAGAPTLSVGVSAWATDITVQGGRLLFPRISGSEIFGVGIPTGHVGEYPSSPEEAIELTAKRSGRRVTEVPELIMPLPEDGIPQFARWHLTLESVAGLRTGAESHASKEVFVRPKGLHTNDLVLSVAASTQPAFIDIEWTPPPNLNESYAAYEPHRVLWRLG